MRLQVLTLKPCRQSNSSLQRSTKVKFKESNWDSNSSWNQRHRAPSCTKKPLLKLINALKHIYGSKNLDWKHRIETWKTLACFGRDNLMISHIRHTNIHARYSGYPWKKLQGCSQAVALPMAPPSPRSRAPGNSADAGAPSPQQPVSPAVECLVSPGRTNTRKLMAHHWCPICTQQQNLCYPLAWWLLWFCCCSTHRSLPDHRSLHRLWK